MGSSELDKSFNGRSDPEDRGWLEEQRERIEAAMLEGEDRLQAVLDGSPAAVFFKDPRGRYLMVNRHYEIALGVARERVVGKTDLDLFPKKVADEFRANDRRAIEAGEPVRFEEPWLQEDGERVLTTTKFPLRDGAGDLYGVCGISSDVLELERTRKSLREAQANYRALIEDLPELVSRLTPDFELTYVNEAYCRYFGKSREELIGRGIMPLVLEEDREGLRQHLFSLNRENPVGTFENRGIRADGEVRWQQWTNRAVYDEEGAFIGYQTVGRDFDARKLAEEALKESEERLRGLTDAAFEGIVILEDEKILETNRAYADMFGYEPSRLRGMSVLDLHPPEARDEVRRKVSSGFDELYESVGLRKDGTRFPVGIRGKTAWYRGRSIRVSALRDITERKRAEEALSESEASLVEAQRLAHLGSWEWDVRTGDVSWSDEVFRIYGFAPGEFVPDLDVLMQVVHPDDEELLRENTNGALYKNRSYDLNHRVIRPDGEVRVVHCRGEVVFDGEGEPLRMIGTVHDVTERAQAEEALQESEERHRAVVEQSAEAIWLFDPDTKRVLESNTAFQELLGYTAEELCGMTNYDFVAHSDEDVDATVYRKVQEGRSVPTERRYRRKDGMLLHVEVNGTLISYRGKEVVCSVARDLTGRREAEARLRESEERFRNAFEDAPIGMALASLPSSSPASDRRYLRVNRALCQMLGYSEEELLQKTGPEVAHPEDREVSEDYAALAEEGNGYRYSVEKRYLHADGHVVRVLLSVSLVRDLEGNPSHLIAQYQDVTERKEAEENLRESEERYRAVVEQSVESIFLFDAETKRVLECNTAFQRLLGYSPEELRALTIYDVVALERSEVDSNIRRDLERKRRFAGEQGYRRKDDSLIAVEVSATVIPYRGREAICVLARDVTERKALEERLRHQTLHDPLTGLPNRALFLDRLEQALTRVDRQNGPAAVLFVDLDDFKVVNDSLGHDAGNALLSEAAERLRRCVRPGDTVARLFGDEFVVLLEAPTGEAVARRVAGRIGERLSASFDLFGEEAYVTSSVGIALGRPTEASARDQPEDLLRRADLAMYAAKSRGKAQAEVFEEAMDVRVTERLRLENELRRAVEREEFVVFYQPKLSLGPGLEVVGAEALVRWEHPERGLVPPLDFIPAAEKSGLIVPIGHQVLLQACREAKGWRDLRLPDAPLTVCVNLSARQFRQSGLAARVAEILEETGLEPHCLVLEITEGTLMDDASQAAGTLRELRALGVGVAVDDFGMGYSSLSYLKRFPVDYLKIDRSFIAGLSPGENAEDRGIASAVVGLARTLDLKTVAEGVETAEQLSCLRELGCDLAQGFYFARPVPGEGIRRLFTNGYFS